MQTLAAIQRVWPGRTAAPVDAVTAADDSDPDERRLRPSLELAARRADAVEEHHEDVLLAKDANRSLVHLLGSFPVRVAVTIIHLLRRLLDVLGIGGGPTAVAVAERALLDLAGADSPPSYEAATSAAHPPSPSRKRRRWALPRLRPRTNEQTIVVVQPSGGASESESDSAPSRSRASSIDSTGVSLLTASGAGSGGKVALRPPTRSDEKRPVPSALRVLQRPKVLVLDLDETLIHSTPRPGGLPNLNRHWWGRRKLDYRAIEVIVDGRLVVYTVYQRPFVDLFLTRVSAWFTIVVFTASLREYADPVIDWLDNGRGIFAQRLFRESCILDKGNYVKDLSVIDHDLSRIILVDNSPASYKLNPANGLPIEGFVDDASDEALLDLLPLLDSLRFTTDVRHVLGLRGYT